MRWGVSDPSSAEKRKIERLLGMGSGYILDFSNRTFSEFVLESTGRDAYDAKYEHDRSKTNRAARLNCPGSPG